jgi:hypothetical protein
MVCSGQPWPGRDLSDFAKLTDENAFVQRILKEKIGHLDI